MRGARRGRSRLRWVIGLGVVALLAVLVAVLLPTLLPASSPQRPASFYDPPTTLPAGNGDVVRAEPVTVPLPAHATRVMYRSTDTDGRPIAVTGTVLLPLAPPPGPLRLISYAVGTQGLADRCAPSQQFPANTEYESGSVTALLDRGYAVAVTDYQGLGTPGVHTYVIRQAEAHAVLDMARAARRLGGGVPADGPVALAGYSQGGGASAAAVELAPDYAPDLRLVGAYAGAVPADLGASAAYLDGRASSGLLGYALAGFDAAYPSLGIPGILDDRGRAFLAESRDQCVDQTTAAHPFARTTDLTVDGRPLAEHLAQEPFRTRVEQQRIGTLTPRVPVLVAHSPTDDIVPFDQDRDLARAWCSRGATVTFTPVAAPTHVTAAAAAFPGAVAYLDARFAGVPATPACP